jgi:hypothetical protein
LVIAAAIVAAQERTVLFRCTFCSPRLRSKSRLVMLAGKGRQIEPGE